MITEGNTGTKEIINNIGIDSRQLERDSSQYNDMLKMNHVSMTGVVDSDFFYSHTTLDESFYTCYIRVYRYSKNSDRIPILVSERIADINKDLTGKVIEITGQLRSYKVTRDNIRRLVHIVFVDFMHVIDDTEMTDITQNEVSLDGYLCSKPVFRVTPHGREISDFLLSVHRNFNKTDLIPCICWGRNARFSSMLEKGLHVKIVGRLQDRLYHKKIDNGMVMKRTVYEVSVNRIKYRIGDKPIIL